MSKQSLDQVIQRASSDARFKASLSDNFEGAVRQYDLTDDEKARLAKGLGLRTPSTVHPMPAAVAASIEASSLEASSLEASSLEASSLEASSLEASTLEASTLEASTLEASTLEASTLEASTLEAS
jgi:hypothetical protein